MIHTISRDGIIFRDYPRTVLDMAHLESLITPLVKSTQETQKQLDAATDPAMATIRAELQGVLDQQKDALNTISGLVNTFQMGEVMTSMSGPPAQWMAVVKNPNPRGPKTVSFDPFPNYAAIGLFGASHFMDGRLPELKASNVGLGFDPYAKFADKIVLQQKDIAAKESTASQSVLDAARECSGD